NPIWLSFIRTRPRTATRAVSSSSSNGITDAMATVPAAARVLHDDIDADIAALAPWFHNLHLPDGRQTAPDHSLGDFPAFKWREIEPHIPQDLSGWRVLDIGCN